MDKMNEQLNLLDVIRREKNDYKKELERLHYRVKDLNKHIDKYRQEIARLEEEKENLCERVGELEALVQKRDDEI
jgi:chromosome segregation ATPase